MATLQTISHAELPRRLVNFFLRYPPEQYSAKATGVTIPLTKKAAKLAAEARSAPGLSRAVRAQPINYPLVAATADGADTTNPTVGDETTGSARRPKPSGKHPNPFLPTKVFTTGKWMGPKYGLRIQADLVKLAKKYGVEDLLPPGRKSTAFKQQRLIEHGLRIRGTGEGQQVKGHKWERTQGARLEKRREAMENMPALIREWQSVSIYFEPSITFKRSSLTINLERAWQRLEEVSEEKFMIFINAPVTQGVVEPFPFIHIYLTRAAWSSLTLYYCHVISRSRWLCTNISLSVKGRGLMYPKCVPCLAPRIQIHPFRFLPPSLQ